LSYYSDDDYAGSGKSGVLDASQWFTGSTLSMWLNALHAGTLVFGPLNVAPGAATE